MILGHVSCAINKNRVGGCCMNFELWILRAKAAQTWILIKGVQTNPFCYQLSLWLVLNGNWVFFNLGPDVSGTRASKTIIKFQRHVPHWNESRATPSGPPSLNYRALLLHRHNHPLMYRKTKKKNRNIFTHLYYRCSKLIR